MKQLLLFVVLFTLCLRAGAGTVESAGNGLWSNPLTWQGGMLPGAADTVLIKSGHAVQLDAGSQSILALRTETNGSLEIYFSQLFVEDSVSNDGALSIAVGELSVVGHGSAGIRNSGSIMLGYNGEIQLGSASLCNRRFESTGLLTVGNQTVLNIYGQFVVAGGLLEQTGGSIVVNGNSGSAATSVPQDKNIIAINASTTNCSGGDITIVNTHESTMFPLVNDVEITGNNPNAFSGTHTFYIGDGSSNMPGPVNRGFNFGNGYNGDKAPIQNLVVRSGNGYQRQFRTSILAGGGTYIKGTVLVTNNSDFQHFWIHKPECVIGGDITVDAGSYFTTFQNLTLGGADGSFEVSADQTLNGSLASFRNEDISFNVTANFGALTINHANRSMVDVSPLYGDMSIADSLTMKQGFLKKSSAGFAYAYDIRLGISAMQPGKLIYQSGEILLESAEFARWINAGPIADWSQEGFFPVCLGKDLLMLNRVTDMPRHFYLSGQPSASGLVTVSAGGTFYPTELRASELMTINGYTMDAVSYGSSWSVRAPGLTGSFNIRGRCGDVILEQGINGIFLTSLTPLSPTASYIPATGAIDSFWLGINGVDGTELQNGTFFLAGQKANMITRIPSKQSGNYDDTATWKYDVIPGENYGSIVSPGHTVSYSDNYYYLLSGMQIEPGGLFEVNVPDDTYEMYIGWYGTEIKGGLNMIQGTLYCEADQNHDTAIWIKPGGNFNQSGGKLQTKGNGYMYGNYTRSCMVNEGGFEISGGELRVKGAMQHYGNSSAHFNGGNIYINGNGGSDTGSTRGALFDMQTEGNVTSDGTRLYIINPHFFADSNVVKITRNAPSGMDLRKLHVSFGSQPGGYFFNTTEPGDPLTGYKVETKGGNINMPLGKMTVNGGVSLGRQVRNGEHGFFVSDTLFIEPNTNLFLFNTCKSIFAGSIMNNGGMMSSGEVVLGGTPEFPATKPARIHKGATGVFSNSVIFATGQFNKLEINSDAPNTIIDFPATVTEELQLTTGRLKLKDILTLGTSAAQPGQLIMGDGRILAHAEDEPDFPCFQRWFNTSTVGLGDVEGLFPFSNGYTDDFVYIGGTPSTAGIFGVKPEGLGNPGGSNIGITDAGVTVDEPYFAPVRFVRQGFECPSLSLRVQKGGLPVSNASLVRLVKCDGSFTYSTAPGNHVSSSMASDVISVDRNNINAADLTAGITDAFVLAGPVGGMGTYVRSVQNGAWHDPSTWSCNCVPGAPSWVTIVDTVDFSGSNAFTRNIVVDSSGMLKINSDTLSCNLFSMYRDPTLWVNGGILRLERPMQPGIGTAEIHPNHFKISSGGILLDNYGPNYSQYNFRNYLYLVGCDFDMTGGFLYINGMLIIRDSTNFNFSGGNIYVNGNSNKTNTVAYTDFPLVTINGADANRHINMTGGDLYILNPHRFDQYSLWASNIYQNNNTDLSGTTIHLGMAGMDPDDIVYNNTTTNSLSGEITGFKITTQHNNAGTYPVPIGNLVVEGGGGLSDGRHAYVGYDLHTTGDVTIMPESDLRLFDGYGMTYIGGNLVNNGLFSNNQAWLTMGGDGYSVSNPQTLSGNGRFRSNRWSLAVHEQEPFINGLYFDNAGTQGVTVDVPGLSVLRMSMLNGDIHVANGNTLTFGTPFGANPFYAAGSGAITGKFKRYIYSFVTDYDFPVGIPGIRRNINLNFAVPPAGTGGLTAEFIQTAPGNNGLPLTEGTIDVNAAGADGYWRFTADANLTGVNYDITAQAKAFGGVTDHTKLVLLKRPDGSSPWTLEGIHAPATGSNTNPVLKRMSLTSFSDFGVGGDWNVNPLPLSLIEFNAQKEDEMAKLSWATGSERDLDHFVIERSVEGKSFKELGKVAGNGSNSLRADYTWWDMMPARGMNYYRLKLVSLLGEYQYSQLRQVKFGTDPELLKIFPNPAHADLTIQSDIAIDKITVLDYSGRRVYEVENAGLSHHVDVTKLARGVYVVNVSAGGTSKAESIVVE
jgi:hypothetical protein